MDKRSPRRRGGSLWKAVAASAWQCPIFSGLHESRLSGDHWLRAGLKNVGRLEETLGEPGLYDLGEMWCSWVTPCRRQSDPKCVPDVPR
mmetsp:Transcript_8730/g.24841  ORF Transcript_8730/g.24841 Transcript_8730/m.24841 type:complete len:89 (-) Transcript_8730:605-871(-)